MLNSNNVMIDVATFGLTPDSVIANISAVIFNFDTGVTDKFSQNIMISDQVNLGRVLDKSSIEFWKTQPKELFDQFKLNRKDLKESLQDFAEFIKPAKYHWSNGAAFDQPIIEDALRTVNLQPIWKHYNSMCFRSIMTLLNVNFNKLLQEQTKANENTNLTIAEFQANLLITTINKLKLK